MGRGGEKDVEMNVFEDVLRTLKRRLEGKVMLDNRPLPVNIDYPDPHWVKDNRPCLGILWYDVQRDYSREGTGVLVDKDLEAMTATVEPYPQQWDMFLQFDLFTQKTLHDIRGMAQLIEAMEALANRELRTETLDARIRPRYVLSFRDSGDREFHSGLRYAISVPVRIKELQSEHPLVQSVRMRMYEDLELEKLDRELEVP